MHRPNTLYHNTAVNLIETSYTAFYTGDSIQHTTKQQKPVERL